jgi:hypothetical protein
MFYGHAVYFSAKWHIFAFWYILWTFGIFFHVWVCCSEKNLATLNQTSFVRAGLEKDVFGCM